MIPYTLAENAGLQPIHIVTELRNRHVHGEKTAGINVRKVDKPFSLTLPSPLLLCYFLFLEGYYLGYSGRECCAAVVGVHQ